MHREEGNWYGSDTITSKDYVCGHCSKSICSEKGYRAVNGQYSYGKIYICHKCNKPTYFSNSGHQTPGAILGENVEHLPDDVAAIYKEIRDCTTTGSYTASVLASRKLLMHIAVSQGAETGKQFVTYVNYLATNGYTPPNSSSWVDQIRQIGNEANHEIIIMNEVKAKTLIKFVEMLLKFIYEFPAEVLPEDSVDEQSTTN